MAASKETTWKEPVHSNAKRVILRKFLEPYFPVICTPYHTIEICDFFAGPGQFSSQEEDESMPPKEKGSPLITLEMAIDYLKNQETKDTRPKQIKLFFNDKQKRRVEHLKTEIIKLMKDKGLKKKFDIFDDEENEPPNKKLCSSSKEQAFPDKIQIGIHCINIHIHTGKFEDFPFSNLNGPVFAFIDPFGFKQIPFDAIKSLCRVKNATVFINLMVQSIRRSIGKGGASAATVSLTMGSEDWQDFVFTDEDGKTKVLKENPDCLVQGYMKQLRTEGEMNFCLSFLMRNNTNVALYYLVYGTMHLKGVSMMKEAMNRVTQDDKDLYFSSYLLKSSKVHWEGWKNKQDTDEMKSKIWEKFKGKEVYVHDQSRQSKDGESIERFVLLETQFILRLEPIIHLFKEGKIKVNYNFDGNRATFAKKRNSRVHFMAANENVDIGILKELLSQKYGMKQRYKFNEIKLVFKHTVLSVSEGGEIKLNKYLNQLEVKEKYKCFERDGDNEWVEKGRHGNHEECMIEIISSE